MFKYHSVAWTRTVEVNECLVFVGGARERIARSPRIIYEISGDYGKRDSDAEWLAPKSDYYAAHNNARAYTRGINGRTLLRSTLQNENQIGSLNNIKSGDANGFINYSTGQIPVPKRFLINFLIEFLITRFRLRIVVECTEILHISSQ